MTRTVFTCLNTCDRGVFQVFVAVFSVTKGDAFRLVYGTDSYGNTCDEDNSARAHTQCPFLGAKPQRATVSIFSFLSACFLPSFGHFVFALSCLHSVPSVHHLLFPLHSSLSCLVLLKLLPLLVLYNYDQCN